MRILLMFDLPNQEDYQKREYLVFRKNLLKRGYIMMQYSVYVKAINFKGKIDHEINALKPFLPEDGNIRALIVTEKQYHEMVVLLGNKKINEIYNNSKRYVKI